jgi:glycosyltransferase involved in cell wall biosynthesis
MATSAIQPFFSISTRVSSTRNKDVMSTAKPLISIVIPNYNQGYYLEACIRSILNQSFKSVEMILMDGGSADNSARIISRHRESFAYIEQGPDGGQYNAINEGFKHARGEIFFWLNSDDMLHPGALLSMVEAVKSHPDNFLFTGYPCVWDESDRLRMVRRESPRWSHEYFLGLNPDGPAHYMQQESTFFTKRVWDLVGGLNCEIDLAADFDLWLRMSKHTSIAKLPRLIGGFRQHGQQRSVVHRDKYIQQVKQSIEAQAKLGSQSIHFNVDNKVNDMDLACHPDLNLALNATQANPITLLTSISPRGIVSQQDAITTWIENGFRVISVNDQSEAKLLANDFPEVEFREPSATLQQQLGKPYVPIREVLAIAKSLPGASAIINSDVKFMHRSGMETVLRDLAAYSSQHIYLSSRLDITNPLDQISPEHAAAGIPAITNGEQYIFGFDFLLASSSTWKLVFESFNREHDHLYALGVPWWDYLLPMRVDSLGIGISCFCPPIISHDWHLANYSRDTWRKYGRYYAFSEFGYESSSDAGDISDSLLESLAAQTIRHLQLSMSDVALPNYSMPLSTGMLNDISGYARSQMPLQTAHRFRIRCV